MRKICAAIAVSALTLPAMAADDESRELSFGDFEIKQYVGSAGFSPAVLMQLDTNDEILMACREPQTRDELRAAGIEFLESQVVLLRAMRMLRLEDGKLETLVPLLGAAEVERLRAVTAEAAPVILDMVREELESLLAGLDEQGHSDSAYGLVFSYILDGMVWDFFEEYREVLPRRLTSSTPHWAGEIWGVYPPRRVSTATRSIQGGDLTLKVSLPSGPSPTLDPLLADWRTLREALRQINADGVASEELREKFSAYGLLDEEGALAVLTVTEKPGVEIFELSQRVTEKLTEYVINEMGLDELGKELGLKGRRQTLVITYHELMWDLMDAMEAEGLVVRPRVLTGEAEVPAAAVSEVMLVADRRREGPPPGQDILDLYEPVEEVDDE